MTMKSIATCLNIIIVLCVSVHTASAAPVISIEHLDALQGDMVTVNIMVDPQGVETMGAQYNLYFNNTLLSATEQMEGYFLSHDGANTLVMPNRLNNTIGLVEYGETRIGVTYGVTTYGVLASVTFLALEPGVCSLELSEVILSDPDTGVGEIPDVSINNGTCTIRSTGTGTPTVTQTATTPPLTGMVTPTATRAPTAAPTKPAATPTATMVETAAADQTPPESDSTASLSATPKQTIECPSDEGISGFTSVFATIGLLIALYVVSKGKR